MRFMCVHGSTAGVARAIGLSERHTRRIVQDLLARLDLPNTHALTAWAAMEGLVSPSRGHRSRQARLGGGEPVKRDDLPRLPELGTRPRSPGAAEE